MTELRIFEQLIDRQLVTRQWTIDRRPITCIYKEQLSVIKLKILGKNYSRTIGYRTMSLRTVKHREIDCPIRRTIVRRILIATQIESIIIK